MVAPETSQMDTGDVARSVQDLPSMHEAGVHSTAVHKTGCGDAQHLGGRGTKNRSSKSSLST